MKTEAFLFSRSAKAERGAMRSITVPKKEPKSRFLSFFFVSLFLFCNAQPGFADATYKWSVLQHTRRIAVVPAFFCTDSLTQKPANDQERQYQGMLRSVIATFQAALPKSLTMSGRFQVAPADLTARALHALRWTPRDLYRNKASLQGNWPVPDPKRLAALAKRLKVDAILLCALREPASIGRGVKLNHETWNPNPLNWSLQQIKAHVVSPRVQAHLVTAQSVECWKDEQMADHPRTNPATMKTLLVDWQEATQLVAQALTDSLTRLPPPDCIVALPVLQSKRLS